MALNRDNKNLNFLFNSILQLENIDECYDFFEDLCTVQELKTLSQRIAVAKMLSEKSVYTDIVTQTGASTATISRVNRSLQYGCDGYDRVFARLKEKEQAKMSSYNHFASVYDELTENVEYKKRFEYMMSFFNDF